MYRLGDFYEMFYDDARIASRVLDLVLTGRACGEEERAPMCGVPVSCGGRLYRQADSRGVSRGGVRADGGSRYGERDSQP